MTPGDFLEEENKLAVIADLSSGSRKSAADEEEVLGGPLTEQESVNDLVSFDKIMEGELENLKIHEMSIRDDQLVHNRL